MFEFARKMAAARRKNPGNDIITQLAFEPLTQREFDVYFVLLATAGNETTRHTITHGLLALLEHPEEMARLRNDPELYKPGAEEMLRWATPVHHFRRTTTQDTELAGTQIPAGAKVTTWFVSGNRDESVFEDPDTFVLDRKPNKHMAFGPGGIHHCMGAHLAKLEIKIAFEELLKRVDDDRARGGAGAAALELLQRHQAPAGAGDAMIALRRIDHISIRTPDVRAAVARWCAEFGLVEREPGRLACDDEPFCLELTEGEPGVNHVAYELRKSCSLEDAQLPGFEAGRGRAASAATRRATAS